MTVALTGRKPSMPPEPICPITVEEYYRMLEAGVFSEDAHLELIEGFLVPKMTHKPPHDTVVDILGDVLREVIPSGWCVRGQVSIRLPDGVPEPDGALARGTRRDYLHRHPGPKDLDLVIEVADTTLARDRGTKWRSYARAGIPVYWIINLKNEQVEVYWSPTGATRQPRFRKRHFYQPGESVPLVLDGDEVARIPVAELLP